MLSKLLKYDFKALKRILLPLLLCVIGASILGSVSLTILLRQEDEGVIFSFGMLIASVITIFMIITIIASIAVVAVVMFVHFYKSFVTNEAYLTFTLPVSIKDHLLSKMISGYFWIMLSGLVVLFSGFIIAVFGTASSGIINSGLISGLYDAFEFLKEIWDFKATIILIQIILLIIVYPMTLILQYYTAVVIGGVIAKKNKLLASIGFVFLIDMVVQVLYQIMYFITLSSTINEDDIYGLNIITNNMIISLTFYLVIFIGLAISYFFTSKKLLENKLNLE